MKKDVNLSFLKGLSRLLKFYHENILNYGRGWRWRLPRLTWTRSNR